LIPKPEFTKPYNNTLAETLDTTAALKTCSLNRNAITTPAAFDVPVSKVPGTENLEWWVYHVSK